MRYPWIALIGLLAWGANPSAVTADMQQRNESFRVDRLRIDGLAAELDIQPHNGSDTRVSASGSPEQLEGLEFSNRGGALSIRSTGTSVSGSSYQSTTIVGSHTNIVVGPGSSSSVTIGGVPMEGSSTEAPMRIRIQVPVGQPLEIDGLVGDLTTGDLRAPLFLNAACPCDLTFGRMGTIEVSVTGSVDARFTAVDGDARIKTTGSASVAIEGGRIGSLEAKVTGSGDVEVDAPVERADLAVVGSGDIRVDSAREVVRKRVVGSGDIEVGS